MKRILLLTSIAVLVAACASGGEIAPGEYAAVNGARLHFERYGSGRRPLVLIHGTSAPADRSFGAFVQRLATSRRVIVVEMQGSTSESMADDVAALIRYLHIESADLLGWSMGGNVALRTAIRHPDVVRKVIVSGASLETTDVAGISAPVLVMAGDADAVSFEHALEMFRLLQRGPSMASFTPDSPQASRSRAQLAVLPGTGADTLAERAGWVVSIINMFLEE